MNRLFSLAGGRRSVQAHLLSFFTRSESTGTWRSSSPGSSWSQSRSALASLSTVTCTGRGRNPSTGSNPSSSSLAGQGTAYSPSPSPSPAASPCTSSSKRETRSAPPSTKDTRSTTSSPKSSSPSIETTSSAPADPPSPCPATVLSTVDSLPPPPPSSRLNPSPDDLPAFFALVGLPGLSSSPSALENLRLFLAAGVLPASIVRLSRRRSFERVFTFPVSDVSAKIDLFGPALLNSHPYLLELGVDILRPKVEFFMSMGLCVTKMTSFGRVFKVKLASLERRVSYLRDLGLSPDRLAITVRRYPYILCANIERTMIPAVEFLEKDCQLPRKTVCRFVAARPCIISLSRANLVRKAQFFESLGIDRRCPQFYTSLVELSNLSPARLQARINWLMSNGISKESVKKLLICSPFVLCCSETNVEGKLKYLIGELNRGIEEIIRYPTVLAFSLERRIKPRFAVIAQLQERGLLMNGNLSLSVILNSSDDIFKGRFIDKLQDNGGLEKSSPHNNED